MIRTMAMAAALLCAGTAQAQVSYKVIDGPIDALVTRVLDGDSFEFIAFPWPEIAVGPYDLRVDGVDSPEIRGKCVYERERAQRAKAFTEALIKSNDGKVKLSVIGCRGTPSGGFGRCRAKVNIRGTDLTTALINSQNARENHGEARSSWCDGQ